MSTGEEPLFSIPMKSGKGFMNCYSEGPPARLRLLRSEAVLSKTVLSEQDMPQLGTLCLLLLTFTERGANFRLHGTLTELTDDELCFELLAEESDRLNLVLVCASGESLPYRQRRSTRLPCQFAAVMTDSSGQSQEGKAAVLGAGGAHFLLSSPLERESEVSVEIQIDAEQSLNLLARIAGSIGAGPSQGSSVEFLFRSASERDQVARIVEKLRSDD